MNIVHDHWPSWVSARLRELRVLRADAPYILGGPSIAARELQALTQDVADLLALLGDLPARTHGGDLRAFGRAQGLSEAEVGVLLGSGLFDGGRSFARADLIRTADGFRLLEFNVGSSVGGMALASAPALAGLPQPQAPLAHWARFVAGRVTRGSCGAIVEDSRIVQDEWPHLACQAQALSQACGGPVGVVGHLDVLQTPQGLVGPDGPLDWIYPAYTARDVQADPAGYEVLCKAIAARQVALPVDLSAKLLDSKLLLALLWEGAASGLLDEAECRLVRRLVPPTTRLVAAERERALREREQLVLKPGIGYGGFGVQVGCEATTEAWVGWLDEALRGPLPTAVLQQRCDPLPEEAVLVGPDGRAQVQPVQFVWGLYVAGGQACGEPLMRCKPLQGSRVINYACGAAAGLLGPLQTTPAHLLAA